MGKSSEIDAILGSHICRFSLTRCMENRVIFANNGVFPKWSRTFTEFSEFRETDKSVKHELGSI